MKSSPRVGHQSSDGRNTVKYTTSNYSGCCLVFHYQYSISPLVFKTFSPCIFVVCLKTAVFHISSWRFYSVMYNLFVEILYDEVCHACMLTPPVTCNQTFQELLYSIFPWKLCFQPSLLFKGLNYETLPGVSRQQRHFSGVDCSMINSCVLLR